MVHARRHEQPEVRLRVLELRAIDEIVLRLMQSAKKQSSK